MSDLNEWLGRLEEEANTISYAPDPLVDLRDLRALLALVRAGRP